MRCSVFKERKSEALRCGRGGRSPETSGEVVHTVLGGPFLAVAIVLEYLRLCDQASQNKLVVGLKTRDIATDVSWAYMDEMAHERVAIKCISGDDAGEVGRSVKFAFAYPPWNQVVAFSLQKA